MTHQSLVENPQLCPQLSVHNYSPQLSVHNYPQLSTMLFDCSQQQQHINTHTSKSIAANILQCSAILFNPPSHPLTCLSHSYLFHGSELLFFVFTFHFFSWFGNHHKTFFVTCKNLPLPSFPLLYLSGRLLPASFTDKRAWWQESMRTREQGSIRTFSNARTFSYICTSNAVLFFVCAPLSHTK